MAPKKLALAIWLTATTVSAHAQYLYWKPEKSKSNATAMYGEIQVFATSPKIYFCGCNWWPAAAAGGYTGIQDSPDGHRAIFSIWDTSKELHPKTIAADPRVKDTRFTSEGSGAHNHLLYNWRLGQTYRFYATKHPDQSGQNTIASVYFYDDGLGRWTLLATIESPNGDKHSVPTFAGNLMSFLENYGGEDREAPKLAIYRLWLGTGPDDLEPITKSSGKGTWGILNNSFFLAEGNEAEVQKVIDRAALPGQGFQFGVRAVPMTIPAQPIPAETLKALRQLD